MDFVKKESFLTGFVSDKRPLTVFEITSLFSNAQLNALGNVLLTGFIQISKSKDLLKYFMSGKELSNKYYRDFSNILLGEELAVPPSYAGEVMDSTVSPFSKKLMLFHSTWLTSLGLSTYGTALASVQRRDLTALYVKVMAQVGIYANDGVKLMIENEWMEQPPWHPIEK